MYWVTEEDTQGLKGSLITKSEDRNALVANVLVEMLTHKTHPKELIALQEVSNILMLRLTDSLPEGFHIWRKGELAIIYNKNIFSVNIIKYQNIFTEFPNKFIMEVQLSIHGSNSQFCLVNIHIPGNPKHSLSSRRSMARYMKMVSRNGMVDIASRV